MWNYPYENGYDIYNNCGYNLIGTPANQNPLYYINNLKDDDLQHSIANPLIIQETNETPINYVDEILLNDQASKKLYSGYNGDNNQHDYYDSSTEPSTKEDSYFEPESNENSNTTENISNYDPNSDLGVSYNDKISSERSLKGNLDGINDKEYVKQSENGEEYDKLSSNSASLINDINKDEGLNQDISNNVYDYGSYPGLAYDPWNMSNMEGVNLNQMNATYFWDPNGMNSSYYSGYNGLNPIRYDDVGYNTTDPGFEAYNMTQDPYTMSFMKTAPNAVDMSNSYSIPYGNMFSPNEAFVTPSIKYPNNVYNNFIPVEQNNFFMSQNLDSQYGFLNKTQNFKQTYTKNAVNDTHAITHTNNRMDLMPNNIKNESKYSLKSIDEDILEGFIYNGNIKKIDMSSIDFINMSDRIWQALRGAGLFKLGNKGRAILKSKISKHLKMYPELRMRTARISGVRRATTRQLFQLAQVSLHCLIFVLGLSNHITP